MAFGPKLENHEYRLDSKTNIIFDMVYLKERSIILITITIRVKSENEFSILSMDSKKMGKHNERMLLFDYQFRKFIKNQNREAWKDRF